MRQRDLSQPDWSARLLWTLAGVVLLDWAFQIEPAASEFRWAAAVAMLAGAWGLATVLVSWVPRAAGLRGGRPAHLLPWATALVMVLCFATWAAISAHGSPAYGTDELAFDQYAAELVRHGINPYTHDLNHAFALFRTSPGGYTFTLTGHRVTRLSYPALSFLPYVPFLALGWSTQLGIGLDVIGWSLASLLSFAFLPRHIRPAAIVLGSVAVYMQLALIGLTDMLFMPLLVIAAYRWDRFGSGWRSYAGPIAFGLAMAVKQTPWPVLPFILVALALDERARTTARRGIVRAGRYLLWVIIAFLVPNLAFIIASPGAWARGTFTPVVQSLVPAGQGAIGLTLFLHIGGGSLTAFSILLALVLLLALLAYAGTYPLLRAAIFVLPAIAYFFAMRSYADYLLALLPPGLIAAVSASAPPADGPRRALVHSRAFAAALAGVAAACVVVAAYALASSSPLSVTITRVDVSGANNIGNDIHVRVRNGSGAPARPAFTLGSATGVSSFWLVLRGPRTLAAGRTADYLLGSPDTDSQFSVDSGITVLAFLTHPASVSVSDRYSPVLWHVGFDPESFDTLIALGRPVVLRAQLLDQWDRPIARSGVPVTLRQGVQGRARIASINGGAVGHRAVALTNAHGLASFTIIGRATSIYADSLRAGLPSGGRYPYLAAASDPIQLRFTAP